LSWFRRKPTVKNPPLPKGHRNSPASQRLLKETKEATKPTTKEKAK